MLRLTLDMNKLLLERIVLLVRLLNMQIYVRGGVSRRVMYEYPLIVAPNYREMSSLTRNHASFSWVRQSMNDRDG